MKQLNWSGYTWNVKSGYWGPGPNYFSDSTDNVFIDQNNNLHLKITYNSTDNKWYCAEIFTTTTFGPGTFTTNLITNPLNPAFDNYTVAGIFYYLDDNNELDIEYARWDNPNNNNLGNFTVQPNIATTQFYINSSNTINKISWHNNGNVDFETKDSSNNIIKSFQYTGPKQTNSGGSFHLNLWLRLGNPPSDSTEKELIISNFKYYYKSAPRLLRGVNWSGVEYRALEGLDSKLTDINSQWKANILRFSFNREDYMLDRPNCIYNCIAPYVCDYTYSSTTSYRQVMRNVQSWCQNLGITLILNLMWENSSNTGFCTTECPCPTSFIQPPIPDHDKTVAMWETISQEPQYKNNPLVWFDIWNEPHDTTINEWKVIANDSVNAIRNQGANNICLVAGIDWAYNIAAWRGNYLTQNNVIYSSHAYGPSWGTVSSSYDLDGKIGPVLSDNKPVFIGEFGADWSFSGDRDWLVNYALPWFDGIGRNPTIPTTPLGWTAWGMTNYPNLTTGDGITPSLYGSIVQKKLKENINPNRFPLIFPFTFECPDIACEFTVI